MPLRLAAAARSASSSMPAKMGAGVLGDLKQCRAVTDTRINGRIRRRGHEQGADVLGFLYRQGIVTEFEATSISHFFLHGVRLIEGLLKMGGISHRKRLSPGFGRARCRPFHGPIRKRISAGSPETFD